jgi:hypothetical protein
MQYEKVRVLCIGVVATFYNERRYIFIPRDLRFLINHDYKLNIKGHLFPKIQRLKYEPDSGRSLRYLQDISRA